MVVLPASQNRYRATVAFEAGFRTFTDMLVSWHIVWLTDSKPEQIYTWQVQSASENVFLILS